MIKRTLSVLLVLTLVFTTFMVFDPTVFFPTAKAGTYDRVYASESYGTATTYVSYVANAYDGSKSDCKKIITNAGYTLLDKDLNGGAGGKYVYTG